MYTFWIKTFLMPNDEKESNFSATNQRKLIKWIAKVSQIHKEIVTGYAMDGIHVIWQEFWYFHEKIMSHELRHNMLLFFTLWKEHIWYFHRWNFERYHFYSKDKTRYFTAEIVKNNVNSNHHKHLFTLVTFK